MIITLIGADFSGEGKNIGTLSTWSISRVIGSGATYAGPSYVDKDAALSATVTLDEGYEVGAAGVTVTMGGTTQSGAASVSGNVVTISISKVTGNVVIKVPTVNASTGEEDSGSGEGGTTTDTEIGTTTTFGSTNVEVTIIGKFSDFNFANKCVVSTAGGSSCSLNTAGASGRVSSPNQVLKVSGGETLTFNSSISGLQYALIEFTDKPCTLSTLNKSGQYGQAWTTEASMTLHSNTKYLAINFNNGSTDMTSEQLESLKTAIVLS